MKHGSLFSGIGGFDLASQWMGWENVFHCEWMEFPRKVLHHYWPDAISYQDITQTDFTKHHGTIDILTGGFPCQPYSSAGKRKGKDDERHLWPHMLRAIREIQPRWVVGENVFGIVTWNDGLVFEEVCAELESEGYEVQPFILPAAAVNAPHRRDRVWFVAYAPSKGLERPARQRIQRDCQRFTDDSERRLVANADGTGLSLPPNEASQSRTNDVVAASILPQHSWENWPTVAPICGGDDGIPRELDGITFPKWRNESIKGYGNAIVPQVALQIFRAIAAMESLS
jgi:DNA (cytosine-5)-methyltransferase 1